MVEVVHWVACVVLGGPFALGLAVNLLVPVFVVWSRKSASLVLPFCCGPVCALACWLSPSDGLQRWAWVPLVLDISLWPLPLILAAAVGRLFRRPRPAETADENPPPGRP